MMTSFTCRDKERLLMCGFTDIHIFIPVVPTVYNAVTNTCFCNTLGWIIPTSSVFCENRFKKRKCTFTRVHLLQLFVEDRQISGVSWVLWHNSGIIYLQRNQRRSRDREFRRRTTCCSSWRRRTPHEGSQCSQHRELLRQEPLRQCHKSCSRSPNDRNWRDHGLNISKVPL